MTTGYTIGMEPSGREFLICVIKGTFVLPASGAELRLHEVQQPLVLADTFTGEPGYSAPVLEADFVLRKPSCDVMLNGSAYAPAGRAAARTTVEVHVGTMHKSFDVVGDRHWHSTPRGPVASRPTEFDRMPITYDRAFGGSNRSSQDPGQHSAYAPNPVGTGWLAPGDRRRVALPNTEAKGQPVASPHGSYAPMAFGPIGRAWAQRARHAGTYDQRWIDEVFPFLPNDFDERFYQAAPGDQRISIRGGPLDVALVNVTPDGLRQFTLPGFEAPVHVFARGCRREDLTARLDTIVFEPDEGRVTMAWRAERALVDNLHEIDQLVVGRKGPEWWQQRESVAFPIPVVAEPYDAPSGPVPR